MAGVPFVAGLSLAGGGNHRTGYLPCQGCVVKILETRILLQSIACHFERSREEKRH